MMQPGLYRGEADTFLDECMIKPDETIPFIHGDITILGVDIFTQKFFKDRFNREFKV